MSDIILSPTEQKLFDFIKDSKEDVTIKIIEEKLGGIYTGALGKLMNLNIIASEKKRPNITDSNLNPHGKKYVKCYFIKKENK